MASDDLKPSDFFSKPENTVLVDRNVLAVLLDTTRVYWTTHLRVNKALAAQEQPKPIDMMIESLAANQLINATSLLYGSLTVEDRQLLCKLAQDMPMSAIPKLPNPEDIFNG